MNQNAKRPAIYLEPDLQEALRFKAAVTNRSVSALVNQAVREALREDEEDLSAFEEQASEPTLSYEELPTLSDLYGIAPGATGGKSSEQFVENCAMNGVRLNDEGRFK